LVAVLVSAMQTKKLQINKIVRVTADEKDIADQ